MGTRIGDRIGLMMAGVTIFVLGALGSIARAEEGPKPPDGRELFTREWLPGDTRSVAGDGLGPMFNDTSCVACHNLGGIGGGGPESKNIHMLSVVAVSERGRIGIPAPSVIKECLAKLHPGFASSRSTVLHRSSLDESYAAWRARMFGVDDDRFGDFERRSDFILESIKAEQKFAAPNGNTVDPQAMHDRAAATKRLELAKLYLRHLQPGSRHIDGFVLVVSTRNTTALFGAGLIDTIPESAIRAGERQGVAPEDVSGRVARLKDGRIGRFG